MSESIPSSVASFAHRRSRHDSTVSFTFFQQPGDISEWLDEEAVEEASDDDALEGRDVYPGSPSISTRTKHGSRSRSSVEYPLLGWNGSTGPYAPTRKYGDRVSQKIYIVTEDLTAVVTGFSTTIAGFILYIVLCLLSGGIAYLLFRWLPRWRIRIIGSPTPLETCQWVAVEVSKLQFFRHRCTRLKLDRTIGVNLRHTRCQPNPMGMRFLLSLEAPTKGERRLEKMRTTNPYSWTCGFSNIDISDSVIIRSKTNLCSTTIGKILRGKM